MALQGGDAKDSKERMYERSLMMRLMWRESSSVRGLAAIANVSTKLREV